MFDVDICRHSRQLSYSNIPVVGKRIQKFFEKDLCFILPILEYVIMLHLTYAQNLLWHLTIAVSIFKSFAMASKYCVDSARLLKMLICYLEFAYRAQSRLWPIIYAYDVNTWHVFVYHQQNCLQFIRYVGQWNMYMQKTEQNCWCKISMIFLYLL